jgi:hypothetical protein
MLDNSQNEGSKEVVYWDLDGTLNRKAYKGHPNLMNKVAIDVKAGAVEVSVGNFSVVSLPDGSANRILQGQIDKGRSNVLVTNAGRCGSEEELKAYGIFDLFDACFYREDISTTMCTFCEVGGRIVPMDDVYRRDDEGAYFNKLTGEEWDTMTGVYNPERENDKDLSLVRHYLSVRDGYGEDYRAVMVGNWGADDIAVEADERVPLITVNACYENADADDVDVVWAQRDRVRILIDKLFEGVPFEVFDALHKEGESGVIGYYRSCPKDDTRIVTIGGERFNFIKRFDFSGKKKGNDDYTRIIDGDKC